MNAGALLETLLADGAITSAAYVGSRVTCVPAPLDTDLDVLVLTPSLDGVAAALVAMNVDFEWDGSDANDPALGDIDPDDRFQSFSAGEVNLIATESDIFYERFLAATSVAKRLNLLDKADRVALFQAVLYGNACAPVEDFA